MTLMTRQPPPLRCYLTSTSSLRLFLSRAESFQPLSVSRSVHLSPPLSVSPPLLPWCFLSFHPALSWINSLFLIALCFFICLAISLPYLFLLWSHVARCLCLSRRPVKQIPFHLCPFIFVLFFTLQRSLSLHHSLCLSLPPPLVSSILTSLSLVETLLLIPTSPFWSSYFFSSSGRESFCFPCSHFFLLECRGSHAERSLPHLPFKPLIFFWALCEEALSSTEES